MKKDDLEIPLSELIKEKSAEIGKRISIRQIDFAKADASTDQKGYMRGATFAYVDDVQIVVNSQLSPELLKMVVMKELDHLSDVEIVTGSNIESVLKELQTLNSDIETLPSLLTSSVVIPETKNTEGVLIEANSVVWAKIVDHLKADWNNAYQIPPRVWEEIIAGAFDKAGYDEVTLTPRSGDLGRDVIAIKRGVGSIKIIGSVKAYAPDNPISYDDVRAIVGVMAMETDVSKAIVTTTSHFPPRVHKDRLIQSLLPTRLELLDGPKLLAWLREIREQKL